MKLSVYLGGKRLRVSACVEDCGGMSGRVPLSACQLARLLKAGGGDGHPVYVAWPRGCYAGVVNARGHCINFSWRHIR